MPQLHWSGCQKFHTAVCFVYVVFEQYSVIFKNFTAVSIGIMVFSDRNVVYTLQIGADVSCETHCLFSRSGDITFLNTVMLNDIVISEK
jgi:hypothetical protein